MALSSQPQHVGSRRKWAFGAISGDALDGARLGEEGRHRGFDGGMA